MFQNKKVRLEQQHKQSAVTANKQNSNTNAPAITAGNSTNPTFSFNLLGKFQNPHTPFLFPGTNVCSQYVQNTALPRTLPVTTTVTPPVTPPKSEDADRCSNPTTQTQKKRNIFAAAENPNKKIQLTPAVTDKPAQKLTMDEKNKSSGDEAARRLCSFGETSPAKLCSSYMPMLQNPDSPSQDSSSNSDWSPKENITPNLPYRKNQP